MGLEVSLHEFSGFRASLSPCISHCLNIQCHLLILGYWSKLLYNHNPVRFQKLSELEFIKISVSWFLSQNFHKSCSAPFSLTKSHRTVSTFLYTAPAAFPFVLRKFLADISSMSMPSSFRLALVSICGQAPPLAPIANDSGLNLKTLLIIRECCLTQAASWLADRAIANQRCRLFIVIRKSRLQSASVLHSVRWSTGVLTSAEEHRLLLSFLHAASVLVLSLTALRRVSSSTRTPLEALTWNYAVQKMQWIWFSTSELELRCSARFLLRSCFHFLLLILLLRRTKSNQSWHRLTAADFSVLSYVCSQVSASLFKRSEAARVKIKQIGAWV